MKAKTKEKPIEPSKRCMRPSEGMTRLQPNMIIELQGVKYRVDMVNDCRARCVPMDKIVVKSTMFDKRKGENKEVVFTRTGSSINISPNSECEILGYAPKSSIIHLPERELAEVI